MRIRLSAAAFALLAACGGSDDETKPATVVARGPITLGAPAAACVAGEDTGDQEKHACLHAGSGPFANATASDESAAPAVSKSHTAYTVALNDRSSWVAFQAKDAGIYAFYSNPQVRLAIRGGSGSQLAALCEGPTSGACDKLPYVTQVRLAAGEDTRVALYAESGTTSAMLVIENIE